MPSFRVVVARPLYSGNLGSIARAMKNFGASELVLVNPRARPSDREAIRMAKHAADILEKAKTEKTIAVACRGCGLVVGTTGVVGRFRRGIKNCMTPKELAGKIGDEDKVALVFGSEGVGLTEKEFDGCDAVCSIPASKRYPVMNLSHSVAVMLYALSAEKKGVRHYRLAERAKTLQLARMFDSIIAGLPEVHDKRKVGKAFKNVLARSRPADDEAQALFAALNAMKKKMSRN
ncbi:MAG: TrmJ/YjtD family RNA methyltransferase [Candidatus Micrarchaeota archaeon]